MMNMYVKKPIPVRAIQWNGPDDYNKCRPATIYSQSSKTTNAPDDWFVHSLEAELRLTPGCWVVGPGARGEYWVVDEQIFAMTYEII